MFDLEKLKDNNASFWVFRLPELRKIAAECGWAIAFHGSLVHDLDLMAMPWAEKHTTADELAQRFTDSMPETGAGLTRRAGLATSPTDASSILSSWETRIST